MNIFPKNARVCFIGDSITHSNRFLSHIFAYYIENFYGRKVKFYNCGVAGGTLATMLNNFDDDIIVHNPTHAVIMIGINDSNRNALLEERDAQRFETLLRAYTRYEKNLEILCSKLESYGVEITLCTQTPYDEYQKSDVLAIPGGFALMSAYAEMVRNFARERGYDLCDYHSYISEIAQSEEVINPDRVHPNPDGHYHMAKCFLAFQGIELGDNREIPEYLAAWRDVVGDCRDIRAAEHCAVKDYSLSLEERLEKAKDYISNGENEYIVSLCEKYVVNKPRQAEIEREVNLLTDELYK